MRFVVVDSESSVNRRLLHSSQLNYPPVSWLCQNRHRAERAILASQPLFLTPPPANSLLTSSRLGEAAHSTILCLVGPRSKEGKWTCQRHRRLSCRATTCHLHTTPNTCTAKRTSQSRNNGLASAVGNSGKTIELVLGNMPSPLGHPPGLPPPLGLTIALPQRTDMREPLKIE